ncbi:tetratricopeptide repeat protein [Murdochiella massiliensis]|uniref:tetratricopeptide repeat protein n=1 Tax=Murdochiella massiliensis TaxID=1673723 RepID=UPI00082ACBCD|nr:tetratricopeptide repeat protein [Murdochiella massiliensis]
MTHHDCQCTHDHHGCDDHDHNGSEDCCCHDHDHQTEHHHGPNGECCGQHIHEDSENVESYFRSKNTRVAFIELKEQAQSAPSSLLGVPLPIRMRDFLEGMEETFDREIPMRAILNGMVWMIAIDPTFRYTSVYREFLNTSVKDPVGYALHLGMGHVNQAYALKEEREQQTLTEESTVQSDEWDKKESEEWEAALLSFRGAHLLNPNEPVAAVQYARLLWQSEPKPAFLAEANHLLEQVLAYDEEHVGVNTALGELQEHMGNFLKATAYYSHALAHCERETMKEVLRQSITRIAPDAAMENAIYYLRRADYDRAREALMKAKAESKRYDADYYLGVVYQNTGNFAAAEEAFRTSIEEGGNLEDIYNGLVYALNAQNKVGEAIAAATEGLSLHPDALRLLFNRAVLYAGQKEIEKAQEDIAEILSYDDLSDELFNEVMRLREQLAD